MQRWTTLSHVQRRDGADLRAGGRGFGSRHPDRAETFSNWLANNDTRWELVGECRPVMYDVAGRRWMIGSPAVRASVSRSTRIQFRFVYSAICNEFARLAAGLPDLARWTTLGPSSPSRHSRSREASSPGSRSCLPTRRRPGAAQRVRKAATGLSPRWPLRSPG